MKRQSRNLPASMEHRLSGYALAASAAGVSLLALAQPAEGKVVYTPRHRGIHCGASDISFDLNHDGMKDFRVAQYRSSIGAGAGTTCHLLVSGLGASNHIAGTGMRSRMYYASALPAGAKIGPKSKFLKASGWRLMAAAQCTSTPSHETCFSWGPWAGVGTRYLGLEFVINGKIHYGWARVHVTPSGTGTVSVELTGYAYETIPNKPIIAGKTHGKDVVTVTPATLGHLARGASAIQAWRGTN